MSNLRFHCCDLFVWHGHFASLSCGSKPGSLSWGLEQIPPKHPTQGDEFPISISIPMCKSLNKSLKVPRHTHTVVNWPGGFKHVVFSWIFILFRPSWDDAIVAKQLYQYFQAQISMYRFHMFKLKLYSLCNFVSHVNRSAEMDHLWSFHTSWMLPGITNYLNSIHYLEVIANHTCFPVCFCWRELKPPAKTVSSCIFKIQNLWVVAMEHPPFMNDFPTNLHLYTWFTS